MNNNNTQTDVLGHSPDALAQRKAELLALLAQTAPELISDQQLNIDKLKALLGDERIAGDEHYELSWAGKSAARREIQKTSSLTLRPDANNPANAQHMLIEGENLEVLRVLQKSYYGKVKMIYIDPPYNTGNDSFVYPDNYSETLDEYQRRTGEKNEAGFLNKQNLWKKNSKESGQYHSAWLSMMYPRLYLARNLLRDDGVIFISIDDNESSNLKLLCDEVFGLENFIGLINWKARVKPVNIGDAKYRPQCETEDVLVYQKSPVQNKFYPLLTGGVRSYPYEINQRKYRLTTILKSNRGANNRSTMSFKLNEYIPPEGQRWQAGEDVINQLYKDGYIEFKDGTPFKRYFEDEEGAEHDPFYCFMEADWSSTSEVGKLELSDLIGENHGFDTVKPTRLLKTLIQSCTKDDDLILDFFAGSGTTANSVIATNIEDRCTRQSISVQMPEVIDKDSEAYKAGYRTIADITRARIDKVIAKLKAEHPDKTTDLACAHFTLAPSNFKVWRGDANSADALREQLALFQTAEKPGAQNAKGGEAGSEHQAMLAELLLKHGLGALGVHAISAPKKLAGVTVQRVLMPDNRHMWLCFDPYTEALKAEITQAKPAQVVMLNSCFQGAKADELLANLQLELAGLEIGLTVI
jgi:adenine-specific DNA-methyltransferase